MFNNANQHINVYGDDIEVDYRGYEVKHKQTETYKVGSYVSWIVNELKKFIFLPGEYLICYHYGIRCYTSYLKCVD